MANIFVFGSNLAGRHGKGAALHARTHYGAEYGVGRGKTGCAYAIPTKDAALRVLPLERIESYVHEFILFAEDHPEHRFQVTAIGTGLAGYKHEQIAPMFKGVPSNCIMPTQWQEFL
jgi:hypothetical protein